MSKEYDSLRYKKNKELIKAKQKVYRDSNKRIYTEEQKLAKQNYRKANRKRMNEYHKMYNKTKRAIDPIFKLTSLIRTSIGDAFRMNGYTKKSNTYQILGCTYNEFKTHIETRFESWMNWDNHGLYNGDLNHGWDIDHIIPLSTATNEEDIIKLNHYTNLQPLCSYTNRVIKRDFQG